MKKIVRSLLIALPLLSGLATPALAQVRGAVGPLVGYYRPFGHFDPASVSSSSLPKEPSQLRGVAWGVEGQLSAGGRLGLEGQFALATSTLPALITPAGQGKATSARVTIATLQAQYDVSPMPERVRVFVSAGPALVQHGGDAYRTYGSPRSVGAAGGVSIGVPIASMLHAFAGANVLRYSFDVAMPAELRNNPGSLQHGTQTDAVFQVGVRWGHA